MEQLAGLGMPVPYRVEENDWSCRSGVTGSNSYTNAIWAGSLERLKELAEEWTNKEFELKEAGTDE